MADLAHKGAPSVSIVIPVYNGAEVLAEQLESLVRQRSISMVNVVIADNGSTDSSARVAARYGSDLRLTIADASQRSGNAAARNIGSDHVDADIIVFVDQDDECAEGWLDNMVEALESADVVFGSFGFADDWSLRYSVRPSAASLLAPYEFLPFGLSANMGVRKPAFDYLGGFSEEFQSATDVDFCWRAQLAGLETAFIDEALVFKRKKISQAFRQHYSFGRDDVVLHERHARSGMTRQWRQPIKRVVWLLTRSVFCFRKRDRDIWVRLLGRQVGRLHGSALRRHLYL